MSDSPSPVPPSPAAWGWVGGSAFGLVEVARTALLGRLDVGPVALLALGVLSLVFTGGLGAVVASLAGRLLPPSPSRGTWSVVGAGAAGAAAFLVWWLGAVPPFAPVPPLHGSWWVALLAVAALTAGAGLAWHHLVRGGGVRRGAAIGALAVLVLAGAIAGPPRPRPGVARPGAPSLLLVTIDAARADRFDTAVTARLGEEGVRFAAAFTPWPATAPTHATLSTGRAPWEHGVVLAGMPLPEDVPTLAEVLVAQGYRTGAFVSGWPLQGRLGFRRGFQVYDDDFAWPAGLGEVLPGRVWLALTGRRRVERRGDATVDRALGWLGDRRGPVFAWVHLADPAPPFAPPPPFDTRYDRGDDPRDPRGTQVEAPGWLEPHVRGVTDRRWLVGQYDGEVGFTDAQLQRLLDALVEAGRWNDTLVVVAGTHGLALGEGGRWFVHDGLSDADLHVPLVLRFPGRLAPETVVRAPVELTDLPPTLLALLDVPAPPSWTGLSLGEVIEGAEPPRSLTRAAGFDEAAIAERPDGRSWAEASVRNASWRYVYRPAPGREDLLLPASGEPLDEAGPEEALLADLLRERAREVLLDLDADAIVAPELPPSDRRRLDARGWRWRP